MRTDLAVPFERRETARSLGARWDPARKVWFAPDGVDLTEFIFLGWVPGVEKPSKRVRKVLKHSPTASRGRPR
jgi:hypothetical protein